MRQFTLQRSSIWRRDSDKLQQLRQQDNARFLLFWNGRIAAIDGRVIWVAGTRINDQQFATSLFLGVFPEPTFAINLEQPEILQLSEQDFCELRPFTLMGRAEDIAMAFHASGLFHWQRSHRYCGRCGGENTFLASGHEAQCTVCAAMQFPRTDPAIIVAITHQEKLLLARPASWPEKRMSVIAGFVEPGESVEQAVMREAMEETGLTLENALYVDSQSWPFPQSLMLAFSAQSTHANFQFVDGELEMARWFGREEFKDAIAAGELLMSPSASVAYRLIKRWYEQEGADIRALR